MRSSSDDHRRVERAGFAPGDEEARRRCGRCRSAAAPPPRRPGRGCALAPGQRTRVVEEIVADAQLLIAKGLPADTRSPRACRPRSKCRCRAAAQCLRRNRRQTGADWCPAPAEKPPSPGSPRSKTRLRRPFRYSSSGDFAYRIASLVAFNAANVRAILVFKVSSSAQAISACPGGFMRGGRLNGRYWRPEVAIQSKCRANIATTALRRTTDPLHDLSAMRRRNVRRRSPAPGHVHSSPDEIRRRETVPMACPVRTFCPCSPATALRPCRRRQQARPAYRAGMS